MNQLLAESPNSSGQTSPDCDRWLKTFIQTPLPILTRTRENIHRLVNEKRDTIPRLCEEIIRDAGFTLNMIEQTNRQLKNRGMEPTRSLPHAALLLGIPYIKTLNNELPCIEDCKDESTRGLLLQHYQQNYHAALQSCHWLKKTPSANQDEVFLCAMLQGAETINLRVAAPALAQQLDLLSPDDREAQQAIIGCSLNELITAYATHAYFPQLYVSSTRQAADPASTCLRLARLIARQAEINWYTDRIPELAFKVAEITGLSVDETISQIHRTAVRAARDNPIPGIKATATGLIEYSVAESIRPIKAAQIKADTQPSPALVPVSKPLFDKEIYRNCASKLKSVEQGQRLSAHETISTGIEALHEGLQLHRVSFLMMTRERDALASKYLVCQKNSPPLDKLSLALDGKNLFSRLMTGSQCIWLHDDNREKYGALVPADFRERVTARSFLAMSVFVGEKPIGMFYADNHGSEISLTPKHQQYFKQICLLVGQALMQQRKE